MRPWWIGVFCLVFGLVGLAVPAAARDLGELVAAQPCPAYQSLRQRTNPGAIHLETGRTYRVIAHNRTPPTWLQVEVVEASPKGRWVEIACNGDEVGPAPPQPPPAGGESHVLVLSWQPTFCLTHERKKECLAATPQSPEARRLSLHGLWPQPRGFDYCISDPQEKRRLEGLDAAKEWALLPDPEMAPGTRARLAAVMPGTQSFLERHEWIKHGTCYGKPAEAYFKRTVDLLEEVNASAVGQLLAANAGGNAQTDAIIDAFRTAFGDAAVKAVEVRCERVRGVQNLSEVWIYLSGDVTGEAPLRQILHAKGQRGCAGGLLAQPRAGSGGGQ